VYGRAAADGKQEEQNQRLSLDGGLPAEAVWTVEEARDGVGVGGK